jgi:hypothetical protein
MKAVSLQGAMRQEKASLRDSTGRERSATTSPTGELSSSSLIASIEILKLKY